MKTAGPKPWRSLGWRLKLLHVLSGVALALAPKATGQLCSQAGPGPHTPPATPTPTPGPAAAVTFSASCRLLRCSFTASTYLTPVEAEIQSYSWDFGDGTPSGGGGFIVHEYAVLQPATFLVKLSVRLDSGQSLPMFAQSVAVSPSALRSDWNYTSNFGVDAYGDPVGLQLTLIPTSSLADPAHYLYSWDFGDGSPPNPPCSPTLCNGIVSHTFASPGMKTITLSIVDRMTGLPPNDPGAVFRRTIPVLNASPIASFGMATCQGLTCTLSAASTTDDGPAASLVHSWDFGDGTFGTGRSVDHSFPAGHAYPVTLTVRDAFGGIGVKSAVVTVPDQPPVPSFAFACSGLACGFDASSSTDDNEIIAWRFDFGDGSPAVAGPMVAAKTFAQTGRYVVTLTVTDSGGQARTATRVVSPTTAAASNAAWFVPVAPCRLLDTRSLATGGPPLTSGVARSFLLAPSRPCGIPASAKAIAVNATVVADRASGSGFVQIYPAGQTASDTSIVNFAPDRSPRANNAIVPLQNGTVTVFPYADGAAAFDLVVDVGGYFTESPGELKTASGYQTITPCRLLDTRSQGPPLAVGVPRFVDVTVPSCGIPSTARAVSLNLAVARAEGEGDIRVYPADVAAPLTSALNFRPPAVPQANGVLGGLGAPVPRIAMLLDVARTADVVLDATGYFDPRAPLHYHALVPCRAVDTRDALRGDAPVRSGQTVHLQIQGNCGVPVGARAAAVNLTVVGPGGEGFLTAFPSDLPGPPTAATINFTAGEPAIGNGAIVALSQTDSKDLALFGFLLGDTAHAVIDVLGYFSEDGGPSLGATGEVSDVNSGDALEMPPASTEGEVRL